MHLSLIPHGITTTVQDQRVCWLGEKWAQQSTRFTRRTERVKKSITNCSTVSQKPFQEPETLPASTPAYYPVSYWLAYYKKTLVKCGGEEPLSIRAVSKMPKHQGNNNNNNSPPLAKHLERKLTAQQRGRSVTVSSSWSSLIYCLSAGAQAISQSYSPA